VVPLDVEIPGDIRSILADPDAMCAGAVDEKTIREVDEQFGISIPAEYRAFLREYGATLVSMKFEIYGLVTDSRELNLWSDLRHELRLHARHRLPTAMIPITSDGSECRFYLLWKPHEGKPAGSVIVFGPDHDHIVVAPDFFDFLRQANVAGLQPLT
jgi:hypothetical protein